MRNRGLPRGATVAALLVLLVVQVQSQCNSPNNVFSFDAGADKLHCIDVTTGVVSDVVILGYDAENLLQAWGNLAVLSVANAESTAFAPLVVDLTTLEVTKLKSHPTIPGVIWTMVIGAPDESLYTIGCGSDTVQIYTWSTPLTNDTGPTLVSSMSLEASGPSCTITPLSAAMDAAENSIYFILEEYSESYAHEVAYLNAYFLNNASWGQWLPVSAPVAQPYVGLYFDSFAGQLLTFDQSDNLWSIDTATGAVARVASFAIQNDFLSASLYFPIPGQQRYLFALTVEFGPSTSSSGSTPSSSSSASAYHRGLVPAVPRHSLTTGPLSSRQHGMRPRKSFPAVVTLTVYNLDTGAVVSAVSVSLSRNAQVAVLNSY